MEISNNVERLVEFTKQDITTIAVDVIVNSANPWLGGIGPDLPEGVGGVDGAIHRAAGIRLYESCLAFPTFRGLWRGEPAEIRCTPGDLRITDGFGLPCQKIFHAVAPVFVDGKSGELALLKRLYHRIFSTLVKMRFHSIALPPLGTRAFGMPRVESSYIAIDQACWFAREHGISVCFSLVDPEEHRIYTARFGTVLIRA